MKRLLLLGAAALALAGSVPMHAWAQTPVSIGDENYNASNLTPLSCALTAAGACGTFTPHAGRPFHVQLSGTASASCVLERELDGATWTPYAVTAGGTTTIMHNWTYSNTAISEDETETQASVPVRVDCGAAQGSYTSGTLNVRISQ